MKKFLGLILVLVMIFSLSGCSSIANIFSSLNNGTSAPAQIFSSDDTLYSITAPDDWEEADPGGVVALNVNSEDQNQYVMIIIESKLDFEDSFDRTQYFDVIKANMTAAVENANWTTETEETVDGFPAIYAEENGTLDGIKLQYFIYIVETDKNFYQLIGSTYQSKAEANRASLVEILKSFDEK